MLLCVFMGGWSTNAISLGWWSIKWFKEGWVPWTICPLMRKFFLVLFGFGFDYWEVYGRLRSEVKFLKNKNRGRGLPWWRSGWESACQCRGHGFEPWSGKIPHAAEQLGPWATTTEPERLEPVLRNKRGRGGERPAHQDEEWPPLAATRESPHRNEDLTQPKINK